MSKQKRRNHPEEFKQQAVRLALKADRPLSHIARELDISDGLLRTWLNNHELAQSKNITIEELKNENEELNRLRREVRGLKEDIDILKKASAYFAKEMK